MREDLPQSRPIELQFWPLLLRKLYFQTTTHGPEHGNSVLRRQQSKYGITSERGHFSNVRSPSAEHYHNLSAMWSL